MSIGSTFNLNLSKDSSPLSRAHRKPSCNCSPSFQFFMYSETLQLSCQLQEVSNFTWKKVAPCQSLPKTQASAKSSSICKQTHLALSLDLILIPLFQLDGPNLSSDLVIKWKSIKNACKKNQESSPSDYFTFNCSISVAARSKVLQMAQTQQHNSKLRMDYWQLNITDE